MYYEQVQRQVSNEYIKLVRDNIDKIDETIHISSNPNVFMEDIESNPDLHWNYGAISSNPNLTLEYILKNLDKPWYWPFITQNPGISIEDIENTPDLPWDYELLSSNPNFKIEIMDKYPNKLWHIQSIINNKNTTIEDIRSRPHVDWMRNGSQTEVFSQTFIDKYPGFFKFQKSIMDYVDEYIDNNHFWRIIAHNPNLTLEFIETYFDKFKNIEIMITHPSVTMDFIENNIDTNWCWPLIGHNPNITLEFINKYSHKQICWNRLSTNDSVSFDDAVQDSRFDNANIMSYLDICECTDLTLINPSYVYIMSTNEYISPEFVRKNPQISWQFWSVTNNTFEKYKEKLYRTLLQKHGLSIKYEYEFDACEYKFIRKVIKI